MDSMINFFSSYTRFHHHGSNIQYFSSKLKMRKQKKHWLINEIRATPWKVTNPFSTDSYGETDKKAG